MAQGDTIDLLPPPNYGMISADRTTTMIRRHATAEDFRNWEAYAEKLTDAELFYAARDCRKVEALWRKHDPMVEGFYSDQASTYGTVLARRRKHQNAL